MIEGSFNRWNGPTMEEKAVNKKDYSIVWIFAGMLLGLVIGCVIGISQGNIGIPMCNGLVFGMIMGIGVRTVIKKREDKG